MTKYMKSSNLYNKEACKQSSILIVSFNNWINILVPFDQIVDSP